MQLSEVKNAIDKRKTAYFDGIECFVVGYQLLNLGGNKIYSVGLQENGINVLSIGCRLKRSDWRIDYVEIRSV